VSLQRGCCQAHGGSSPRAASRTRSAAEESSGLAKVLALPFVRVRRSLSLLGERLLWLRSKPDPRRLRGTRYRTSADTSLQLEIYRLERGDQQVAGNAALALSTIGLTYIAAFTGFVVQRGLGKVTFWLFDIAPVPVLPLVAFAILTLAATIQRGRYITELERLLAGGSVACEDDVRASHAAAEARGGGEENFEAKLAVPGWFQQSDRIYNVFSPRRSFGLLAGISYGMIYIIALVFTGGCVLWSWQHVGHHPNTGPIVASAVYVVAYLALLRAGFTAFFRTEHAPILLSAPTDGSPRSDLEIGLGDVGLG
jgi:hypothetical protein